MAAHAWRVEFDRTAARELRKLGTEAERRVLAYLRTRIAGSGDPRRLGQALTGDRQGFWRYRVGDYRIVAAIEDDRFVVLVVTVAIAARCITAPYSSLYPSSCSLPLAP